MAIRCLDCEQEAHEGEEGRCPNCGGRLLAYETLKDFIRTRLVRKRQVREREKKRGLEALPPVPGMPMRQLEKVKKIRALVQAAGKGTPGAKELLRSGRAFSEPGFVTIDDKGKMQWEKQPEELVIREAGEKDAKALEEVFLGEGGGKSAVVAPDEEVPGFDFAELVNGVDSGSGGS